ncbi:MAG: hypothetical protein A2751_01180 [Candidatus Doudnabacteria bacterium RIFCSPHIGHO2_01_FULL_46_14]|uniref:Haloacid dehalogenase n=1 Tax=Candidatus Doudnabacteria bacterium RIFCSPHIGHO2_01_FULL_46_14 TaxID=1817824 RepID=A0A1F5NNF0_9BACT|nr:MAG: hypothetical protein A2751_01180 [Candidatus Doudnabacteria bacterium RIFCSPHIGHO2_01_FULL_46_14]
MIKHIFFDADGMVVSKPYRFSEVLARDYGITSEVTNLFFKNEFLEVETGKADLKEQLPKYLRQWGWQKSLEEFLAYWFKSENYIDTEVIKSIKSLRNGRIKCYLATNQEKYRAAYMKNVMGLDENLFDKIFVSCEVGYLKPSAEFWSAIDNSLGELNKNEVLVWDDKEKCVAGAKQIGFHAELYRNFRDYREILGNYPIK